jgi:hypothetical protein
MLSLVNKENCCKWYSVESVVHWNWLLEIPGRIIIFYLVLWENIYQRRVIYFSHLFSEPHHFNFNIHLYHKNYEETNRIFRAENFIQGSKKIKDIAILIPGYCSKQPEVISGLDPKYRSCDLLEFPVEELKIIIRKV